MKSRQSEIKPNKIMKTLLLIFLLTLDLFSLVRAQDFALTYLDAVPPNQDYLLGPLSLTNHAISMDEDEYFSGASNWPFDDVLHFSIPTNASFSISFTPGQNLWGLDVTLYAEGGGVIAEGGETNHGEVTKDSANFNLTLPAGSYFLYVSGFMTSDFSASQAGSPNDKPFVNGNYAPYEIYTGHIDISAIPPPNLSISQSAGGIVVFWPSSGSFTLQQKTDLTNPAGWTASAYNITTNNGTNSITVTQPVGNVFFRLSSF
jgi:hypothetical protein